MYSITIEIFSFPRRRVLNHRAESERKTNCATLKIFRVDSNFVTDMLMLFVRLVGWSCRPSQTHIFPSSQPTSHEFHETWQNLLTVTEVVDLVVAVDTLSLAWFWLSAAGSGFLVALLLLLSSSEESSTGSSFFIRRGILSFMFQLGTLNVWRCIAIECVNDRSLHSIPERMSRISLDTKSSVSFALLLLPTPKKSYAKIVLLLLLDISFFDCTLLMNLN